MSKDYGYTKSKARSRLRNLGLVVEKLGVHANRWEDATPYTLTRDEVIKAMLHRSSHLLPNPVSVEGIEDGIVVEYEYPEKDKTEEIELRD